jgi:SAM-dependent methyltransferase
MSEPLDAWLAALDARHRAGLAPREFLKAARALSVRYVQRRATLPRRSVLDSAGKRAAFAAFYAVQHVLTAREAVRALGANAPAPSRIVDLGCGTGACAAGWALACETRPRLYGVDASPWALAEAQWNWSRLGLGGRVARADLVAAAERLARPSRNAARTDGIVLGWSVNELDASARDRLLAALLRSAASGAALLLIEPIGRAAAPWWDDWADAIARAGGRADRWTFDVRLPAAFDRTRRDAGFGRHPLTARTLYVAGGQIARRERGVSGAAPLRLS